MVQVNNPFLFMRYTRDQDYFAQLTMNGYVPAGWGGWNG